MKSRALTVLSLAFGLILFSKAYAVSSEMVDEPGAKLPGTAAQPPEPAIQPEADGTVEQPKQQCLTGDIHKIVMADMARVKSRTAELGRREAALAELEKALEVQLAGIEEANRNLSRKIDGLKSVAGDDLKHLVGMYQTMKPKQAAEIFNSMDPAFAAGFLREMDSNTAGLIMANMDARKSYSISVIIASKNAKYR